MTGSLLKKNGGSQDPIINAKEELKEKIKANFDKIRTL